MIRAASENDLRGIRELVKRVPEFWYLKWHPEAWKRAMRASNGLAFVWDEAGDLLGFVCAHDVGRLGYLCTLVVANACDKNIGQELIRCVKGELAARGCATVNSESIGLCQTRKHAAHGLIFLHR